MGLFAIRNWTRFQHYRDRNPPWIKLHFELLSSADWVALDDASRVLAIACMLVGSKSEGVVDLSPTGLAYLRRVAYLNSSPNPKPLISCGFLSPLADASAALADACASVSVSEEGEENTTTTEEETPTTRPRARADAEFAEFWAAYPKKVAKAFARKTWEKVAKTRPPLPDLLAALERMKGSRAWTKDAGEFIPNPATWLNRGGWDDEPEPQATPPPAKREPFRFQPGMYDLAGRLLGEDGVWRDPEPKPS